METRVFVPENIESPTLIPGFFKHVVTNMVVWCPLCITEGICVSFGQEESKTIGSVLVNLSIASSPKNWVRLPPGSSVTITI